MFTSTNNSQQYQNLKPPGYSEPQLSHHNSYGTRSDKSLDDLSKSSSNFQASNIRLFPENNRNFKVMVRVRPPLPRELQSTHFLPTVKVAPDHKKVSIYEYYNIDSIDPAQLYDYAETTNMYTLHSFTFDHVFDQDSTQVEVYETTAKPAVMSVLQGYNATILAYGQTGTGKTHTMEGFKYNQQDPQRGMVPRSMEEIFKYIENGSNSKTTFMVRASYLQIYNEVISDLLRTERTNLHIREDKKRGVFVEGLSEWAVRSPSDIYTLIQKGAMSRATASTKMNDVSSRSHAVFIIIVEQMNISEDGEGQEIRVGKLNLVDLAGSERVRVTGATGKRLEECKKINQSLSALGNVIAALTDQKQPKTHIPYRDSKITRLLEDSLGGNCITTMMAMISPVVEAFGESLSSLKFANRAKNIKNDPIINEDVDQKALLRKYEAELRKLRGELDERSKTLTDKSRLVQLEEDKRRAEQDKAAAFEALEMRSREFMAEREEKKKLEEKIRAMNSQVLQGGKKIEDTPQFRNALEEQQKLIRQQYEKRLTDLEKERQMIEEDKAQVDKYKQLLLKQRDIMIALTTRLNERDETIVQLQEELDAYDRIHRETEDLLEIKSARVEQLENLLREKNIAIPEEIAQALHEESHRDKPHYSHQYGHNRENGVKLYPQYSTEIVKYDEQETYSLTQSNMLTAQEKVAELYQVAEAHRNEITRLREELEDARNNSDTSEFLKNELNMMTEKMQQAEEEQYHLREVLKRKNQELMSLNQQNGVGQSHALLVVHKEIKYSLDNIIESLSSQNEPHKLQNVARELLNLQNLVNSVTVEESADPEPRQKIGNNKPPTVSYSNEVTEVKKVISPQHRHSASASRLQEDLSIYSNGKNLKETVKPPSPFNQGDFPSQPSNSYNNLGDTQEIAGDKASVEANRGPRNRKLSDTRASSNPIDRQKSNDMKIQELSKKLEPAGVSGNMPENVGINPDRRPMTVEEMLRLKRNEAKKK